MAAPTLDYTAAVQWWIGLLKASPDLANLVQGKVYRNLIPQGVPMPAVKVDLITAHDTRYYTGQRALTVATIQTVGITQGDDLQSGALIAAAIDAAVDGQISQNGQLVAKADREMIVDFSHSVVGERFNMQGGRYRVVFYLPPQGLTY